MNDDWIMVFFVDYNNLYYLILKWGMVYYVYYYFKVDKLD